METETEKKYGHLYYRLSNLSNGDSLSSSIRQRGNNSLCRSMRKGKRVELFLVLVWEACLWRPRERHVCDDRVRAMFVMTAWEPCLWWPCESHVCDDRVRAMFVMTVWQAHLWDIIELCLLKWRVWNGACMFRWDRNFWTVYIHISTHA